MRFQNKMRALLLHRSLLYQLIRRDIASRYEGSFLGIFWSFLYPILTLTVYTAVFGGILRPRWQGITDPIQFSLILFSGLLVFNFFSECLNRAPSQIVTNASYVKKVVFPIEILVWVPIGAALFHLALGFLAWVLLAGITGAPLTINVLFFPLILFPLVLIVAGLSWFLSALGVYVRDVSQIIAVITQLLLYLAPIIYPIDAIPAVYRSYLYLNPITVPVEQARNVLNFCSLPDGYTMAIYTVISIIVAYMGRRFFDKTRHGFSDVI